MGTRTARRNHQRARFLGCVLLMMGVVQFTQGPNAAADDYLVRPGNGIFSVVGHGEGHGRGMSQYGAQGAAGIGKSAKQILDFYYPGSVDTQVDPGQTIRVWISGDNDDATEIIAGDGLQVQDGVTGRTFALPARTSRVAAVPSGPGFVIQVRVDGTWRNLDTSENSPAGRTDSTQATTSSDPSTDEQQTTDTDIAGQSGGAQESLGTATPEPRIDQQPTGSSAATTTTVPIPANPDFKTSGPAPATGEISTSGAESESASLPPNGTGLRSANSGIASHGPTLHQLAPQTTAGPVNFFYPAYTPVELLNPSGNTVGYRGILQATRRGSGSITVNYVSLDSYVQGVVPRESPSSWLPAALQAQAIAARTYSYNNVVNPLATSYDICDTASCQVYGGATFNSPANPSWNAASTNQAVLATSGLVRTFGGQPINAQFGSTNGGWTVSGGVAYLPAQPDPWEALANPPQTYSNWKGELRSGDLEARFPSIGSFTRLRITQRDGNGEWGGRVLSAVVEGTAGSRNITGDQLRLALTAPVRSAYFQIVDDAAAHNPLGSLDRLRLLGNTVSIAGWGVDPDSPSAIVQVHLYDYRPDGQVNFFAVSADINRPDVGNAFPSYGPKHGFDTTIPIRGRGSHTVCAYLINQGSGTTNPLLGCKDVTIGQPFGSFDGLSGQPGRAMMSGWAIDPDASTTPVRLHVYDITPAGTSIFIGTLADSNRLDVAALYPGTGANHGFSSSIPLTSTGVHQICLYTINVTPPATNPLLGCRNLTVSNPIGSIDGVASSTRTVTVTGWTFDPKQPAETVQVHVYVDGPNGTSGYVGFLANKQRGDVGLVYPEAGAGHGYSVTVPAVVPGMYRTCVYAITTGAGTTNPLIGCRSIQVL